MLREFLLNLIYPPRCPFCRTSVSAQGAWCDACFSAYWRPRQLRLPSSVVSLDACYTLTKYHGPMRHMLHQLKYEGKTSYSAACHYGLRHFPWSEWKQHIDVVVPVPLAPEKEKARGFNQTELIFKPWASQYWPWIPMLRRLRETKSQWQLSKAERAENIKGAFAVHTSYRAAGKRILLVDDIFTTGATLENCALSLRQNGAAAVTGLVMASDAI